MLLLDEVRDAWRSEPREHRIALVVIVAIAIGLRLAYIAQPMRYDESITWLEFVRRPLAQSVARYHTPSNHLFHTLLAKGFVAVFGNEPWALRMPALIAGVLVVPATWAVSRAIYGARAALIAAAVVAASGVLVMYSTNARGYSMVVLAFLVLVLAALRLMSAPSTAGWAAFSVVATLGLWTIPVMLYPLGAVMLWLGLTFGVDGRRTELRRLAAAGGVIVVLTTLAYMPVFRYAGVAAVVRNRFVTSSTWPDFLADLAGSTAEAVDSWGLGLPPLISLVLLAFALVAITRHAAISSTRVGLPLAAYVWSAWLLVVTHRAPYPRVWLWLLPLVACLVGAGVVAALERWGRTRRLAERRVPVLACVLAAVAAVSVAISGGVRVTTDTGAYRDASATARALGPIVRPGDRLVAAIPTIGPLAYYARRAGLDSTLLTLDEAEARRLIVIVDAADDQSLDAILQSTAARDTTRFSAGVASTLGSTTIVVFARRNETK